MINTILCISFERIGESLFVKVHSNFLFLLESSFNFKIDSSKDLDDNLNIFNKFVQDTTNKGESVKLYKAIILLNAIPNAYKNVKNIIMHGSDILTPEIILDSLRRKDIELRAKNQVRSGGKK